MSGSELSGGNDGYYVAEWLERLKPVVRYCSKHISEVKHTLTCAA